MSNVLNALVYLPVVLSGVGVAAALTQLWSKQPETYKKLLIRLTKAVREEKPDIIVGLNTSGILLAAYVALALNMKNCRLVRMYVDPVSGKTRVNANFRDRVIIIDDFCRSSKTLRLAIDNVKGPQVTRISAAVLFATQEAIEEVNKILTDGTLSYFKVTDEYGLTFPWTPAEVEPASPSVRDAPIREELFSRLENETDEKLAAHLIDLVSRRSAQIP